MNSMRSFLNLRSLASTRIARTSSFQTGIFYVALCAAFMANVTPALAAVQNDTPATPVKIAPSISLEEATARHQTLKFVALVPEDEAPEAAAIPDSDSALPSLLSGRKSDFTPLTLDLDGETKSYYGTWTTYPYVHQFLVSFVAYNEYCEEISAGTWTKGSVNAKYGLETQQHVKGRLSNGDCSEYVFTGAGIYYQWVDKTSSSRSDEFKANWKGGGMENKVTFYLKDKE